ncbi:MAG: hypothetical protein EBU04_06230 [Verrucomicrobia bacterium]|nr:hypothetical protein [Verrucomicrobiota bacterium]
MGRDSNSPAAWSGGAYFRNDFDVHPCLEGKIQVQAFGAGEFAIANLQDRAAAIRITFAPPFMTEDRLWF